MIKESYKFVTNLIKAQSAKNLGSHLHNNGSFEIEDCYLVGKMRGVYCHNVFVKFHFLITKHAEKIFGKELIPTYTYGRVYYKNSILNAHRDRDQCEYSLTLNLDSSDNNVPWPIEFYSTRYEKLIASINCSPGDGIFYKGIRLPHSRSTPCPVEWYAQSFFHWVDKNRPYKDLVRQNYLDMYNQFLNNKTKSPPTQN